MFINFLYKLTSKICYHFLIIDNILILTYYFYKHYKIFIYYYYDLFDKTDEAHDIAYFYFDTRWELFHQKRRFRYFIKRLDLKSLKSGKLNLKKLKAGYFDIIEFLYEFYLKLNLDNFNKLIALLKQFSHYLNTRFFIQEFLQIFFNFLKLNYFFCWECLKFFFKKNFKHSQQKKLTPSLSVYYPIKSSIFSITIRIMGVFSALILGCI